MLPLPGAEGGPSPSGIGSIKGRTAWPGVNPDAQNVSLELRFTGDDAVTKGQSFRLHIGLGRPYTMSDLPAGAYRVEITMVPHHLGPYLADLGTAYAEVELPWIYASPIYVQ